MSLRTNYNNQYNNNNIMICRQQIPLLYGWAITVHKVFIHMGIILIENIHSHLVQSQGMSLDKATLDMRKVA
jgi:hypothetical protein